MYTSNLKKKATRYVKKNNSNGGKLNFRGVKLAMNIRRGKLTISFCKKLFSCINFSCLYK